MANTLKFGNGEWYGKKDTILAYNDENYNYKPLPFSFDRASSATVVNKAGLIETVGSGEPRIDFKDDAKGALLLEPQRTNVIPYSEDFSNAAWILADVTRTLNYGITPEGLTNSVLITEGSGSAQHRAYLSSSSSSSIHTLSVFVKNSNGSRQAYIDMGPVTGFFNFDTETMYSALGTTSVEKWANGWYRISITSTSAFTPVATYLGLGNSNTETFQGNGTSSIEFFAPQLEQGSYATSYIPTQGSTVTRLADACSQTVPDGVIGQTEGTMFLDVNISHIVGNEAIGGINSGGYANHVTIQRIGNAIQFVRNSATQSGATIVTSLAITAARYKLAIAYKSGDTACFLNGTQVSTTQTQTFTNATLNVIKISGDAIGALPISDTCNQAQLYNTRLSNSELQQLTTI